MHQRRKIITKKKEIIQKKSMTLEVAQTYGSR